MKLEPNIAVNALIVALAVGTTVLVVATDDEPTTDQLEARARNLLPSFDRARLRSIGLKAGDASWTLTAERTPDGQPRYAFGGGDGRQADSDAVEALLRALELAGYVRRLTPAEDDRAALGLDRPTATLSVELGDTRSELRFGKEALTPAGTQYLEVIGPSAERATYLVRRELAQDLLVEKDALRPRVIVPFAFTDVTAIAWHGRDTATDIRRASSIEFVDAWNQRVRRDSIDRLGRELASVKSVRFTTAAAAEKALGADPDALTVTLTPAKADQPLKVRLGGTCPEDPALEVLVRVTPKPSAECVSPGLRRLFRETTASLRDDAPFVLHADEVESMRVERKGSALELSRTEKGFRMSAPSRHDVELDAGNGRLEQLVRAAGERLERPELAALGLEPPEGLVRLRSGIVEGSPRYEEVVQIGRARADGRLPVRRVKDGVVLLLPREAEPAYAADTTALKSRVLFDFALSDLASLTITTGAERQRLRHVEDAFELVEPKGFQHDGDRVLDLVQALATLRADRWVADAPLPEHGLSRPQAVLELELVQSDKKTRLSTLTIGADTAGGAFGALDTQPGVFVLPRSFVTDAKTLLLSRAAFQLDVAALSVIELGRPRESITLRRKGDSFVADTSLAPAAVERVLAAISNLRPEAAEHTGPPRPSEGFDAPRLTLRLVPTDTTATPKRIVIGSSALHESEKAFRARIDAVDATYLLPAHAVEELLNAFGG